MKSKSFTPILLSFDEEKKNIQTIFIEELCSKLDALLLEYRKLNLVEPLVKQDLDSILKVTTEKLIEQKIQLQTGGVEIQGLKMKPKKVFELLDLDTSEFAAAYSECQRFIREMCARNVYYAKPAVYDSAFFIIKDTSIQIDAEFLNKWLQVHCASVTNNETQNLIYLKLKAICDALNELQDISPSVTVDRTYFYTKTSTETLKTQPGYFLNEKMDKLISIEGKRFIVNIDFVSIH